jgi:hypothetical protein
MSIPWEIDYQAGLERSSKEGKPILLFFSKPG